MSRSPITDENARLRVASRPSVRRELWLSLAIAVVATAFAWFRMNSTARGTMWAEDGPVFSARSLDPAAKPAGIFTPYDGYTHALPQLISDAVWAVVPIADVAAAFALASCVVAGGVAALVFALTGPWRLHIVGRLILAAVTVAVPNATFEVLGNLANLHWFLLWLAPFLFVFRPRTWPTSVVAAVGVFLVVTSEIQSLLFAPLILIGIRERRKILPGVAVAAGAAVQLLALSQGSRTRGTPPDWLAVIDGYFLHAPLTGLTGVGQGSSALVAYVGWDIAYAAALPFLVCAVWYAWGSRRRALTVAAIGAASVILWVAGFAINYHVSFDYPEFSDSDLTRGVAQLRYAIVPTMLLFAFVGLAVGRGMRERASRGAASATTVLCAAVLLAGFHVSDGGVRGNGPGWAAGIATARAECEDGLAQKVDIPLSPSPWSLTVPCERILE